SMTTRKHGHGEWNGTRDDGVFAAVAAPAPMGDRFAFGKNWKSFINRLDATRILEAEKSLQWLLGKERSVGHGPVLDRDFLEG
ncbi:MAG: hypothetical protein WBL55_26280, partial [Xanthobacteraceae bacterium]